MTNDYWYPADQHEDVKLALRLGYTHATVMDAYDADTHAAHPASWILPVHPFTRVGPLVIVRELRLDARGASIMNRRGTRRRIRIRIRLDPTRLVPGHVSS